MKQNKKDLEAKELLPRDEKAGIAVFRVVYGGMQQGHSLSQIIRDLSSLHFNGVQVGDINHSDYTIRQIKKTLGKTLRGWVIAMFAERLPSTKRPRPVSEIFDKMTHYHQVLNIF